MLRFFISDSAVTDFHGHYFEYDVSVAEAAGKRNFQPVIFANYKFKKQASSPVEVYPIYRHSWGELNSKAWPEVTHVYTVTDTQFSFFHDTRRALRRYKAQAEDILFFPTIGFTELRDILRLLLETDYMELPQLHVLLRRDLAEITGNEPFFTETIKHIKACHNFEPNRIKFYTDTDLLTADYEKHSGVPFHTLPIPFRHGLIEDLEQSRQTKMSGQRPVNIVYLGDARPEKGYQYIPDMIHALYGKYVGTAKVRFILQSNFNMRGGETEEMPQAINQLAQFPRHEVLLLRQPLTPQDYYKVLVDADIVILPYQAHRYQRRSSGVFTEALLSGKVVVVPAHTAMSSELPEDQGVVFDGPAEFPRAVAEAVERLNELSHAAQRGRAAWALKHSPEVLIDTLLSHGQVLRERLESGQQAPLVLYIADANSFFVTSGSGYVYKSRISYLKRSGFRVAVVLFYYKDYYASLANSKELSKSLLKCTETLNELGVGFSWHCLLTWDYSDQPNLQNEMQKREMLTIPDSLMAFIENRHVDLVLTNYVFSLNFVKKLCLDAPIICETIDLQVFQMSRVGNRLVLPGELHREIRQLGTCDGLISINASETATIQEQLPDMPLVTVYPYQPPLPVTSAALRWARNVYELVLACEPDVAATNNVFLCDLEKSRQARMLLKEKSIDLFFVSSYHPANANSLEWFLDKVYEPYLKDRNVNLFVAGTISCIYENYIDRLPRVYWCGRIEDTAPLYAASNVIIAPIICGAGVNIKVIEAILQGKSIAPTPFSLHEFSFLVDETIATLADPECYANYILRLLNDEDYRRQTAAKMEAELYEHCNEWLHDISLREFLVPYFSNWSIPFPKDKRPHAHSYVFFDQKSFVHNALLIEALLEGAEQRHRFLHYVDASFENPRHRQRHRDDALMLFSPDRDRCVRQSSPFLETIRNLPVPSDFRRALYCQHALFLGRDGAVPSSPAALAGFEHPVEILERLGVVLAPDLREELAAKQAIDLHLHMGDSPAAMVEARWFVEKVFAPFLGDEDYWLVITGGQKGSVPAHPRILHVPAPTDPSLLLAASAASVCSAAPELVDGPSAFRAVHLALDAGKPFLEVCEPGFFHTQEVGKIQYAQPAALAALARDLIADATARQKLVAAQADDARAFWNGLFNENNDASIRLIKAFANRLPTVARETRFDAMTRRFGASIKTALDLLRQDPDAVAPPCPAEAAAAFAQLLGEFHAISYRDVLPFLLGGGEGASGPHLEALREAICRLFKRGGISPAHKRTSSVQALAVPEKPLTPEDIVATYLQPLWLLHGQDVVVPDTLPPYERFVLWWAVWGRRAHGLLPTPPLSLVRFAGLPAAANQTAQPLPITKLMRYIWEERDDLRLKFPNATNQDREAYAAWYYVTGVAELDCRDFITQREINALHGIASSLQPMPNVYITNLMYFVWICRSDLHKTFPIDKTRDHEKFVAWFWVYGVNEMQLHNYFDKQLFTQLQQPVSIVRGGMTHILTLHDYYLTLLNPEHMPLYVADRMEN